MDKRNKKGQFVKTTGSTKRKKVQYKGNNMHRYQRVFCKVLGIDELPRELMVHHIDEDTLNDDINNLALMTFTAHNRLHAKDRKVWNKGLTTESSEKLKKTIEKAVETRTKQKFEEFELTHKLREKGLTLQEVADRLDISRRQVSGRLNRYEELKPKYS